jgi:hypothetical protein
VYYVAVYYNEAISQTTAPTLGGSSNAASWGMDFTNSAKILGTKTGATAPITSQAMSGLTVATIFYGLWLY